MPQVGHTGKKCYSLQFKESNKGFDKETLDLTLESLKDFTAIHLPEKKLLELRVRYPDTIHTPKGYFDAFRKKKCSPATVIIAPEGRLYYPCHILNSKGPDLRTADFNGWLTTPEAVSARQVMQKCDRNCGWYQYYAINSYLSLSSVMEALRPIVVRKRLQSGKVAQ